MSAQFRFKELAVSLFRAGHTLEAHRCCCAAARSCDSLRDFYARWVSGLLSDGDRDEPDQQTRRALAEAVSRLGARRGVFEFPAQRPASTFVRGLRIGGSAG